MTGDLITGGGILIFKKQKERFTKHRMDVAEAGRCWYYQISIQISGDQKTQIGVPLTQQINSYETQGIAVPRQSRSGRCKEFKAKCTVFRVLLRHN